MLRTIDELAVQSYCYRGFRDRRELIRKIKETGLRRVELCGVHVDFNDEGSFQEVIQTFQGEGIEIVSIGVERFGVDEAAARKRFEFARRAGCQVISADFQPATFLAALPMVYRLCEEYGVRLGIHNHGGYHWLGNGQMVEWVLSITRPCIGLMMDTAWALDARQDPVEWVKRFGGRIYGVHLKDFVFDRARRSSDVVVGTGNLDLKGLFGEMRSRGVNGLCILEYEGDVDNPVPALRRCVEQVAAAMGV